MCLFWFLFRKLITATAAEEVEKEEHSIYKLNIPIELLFLYWWPAITIPTVAHSRDLSRVIVWRRKNIGENRTDGWCSSAVALIFIIFRPPATPPDDDYDERRKVHHIIGYPQRNAQREIEGEQKRGTDRRNYHYYVVHDGASTLVAH